MARPDITPLHRGVRPIPAEHLRSIFEQPRDYAEVRFVPSPERKATVVERVSDFFNTPFGYGAFIGFVGGSFFTVGAAFVWGLFL